MAGLVDADVDRTDALTQRDLKAVDRAQLVRLGRRVAALLGANPAPLRARDIKTRLGLPDAFPVKRLVKAMQTVDEIVADKKTGHEARWAHNSWIPTLIAHYRWPATIIAPGPDAARGELLHFIDHVLERRARGEVLTIEPAAAPPGRAPRGGAA